ncbi:MAG: AsmA family protein [Candidatus Firestonebacteria bacterium]
MKKALKIVGIICGIFVALVVILMLAASFLIPWDKVKDKIVEKASAELKREVKIEKVSFSLFKGVELKNFYIGNAEGFTKGAFVSAESALAKYDFWALFKKQVILTKIELVKPYILVEKNKKGRYNFSDIMEMTDAPEKNPKNEVKSAAPVKVDLPVELSVSRFAITEGVVKYTDPFSSPVMFVEFKNINVSVNGLSLESVKPFFVKASATMDYNKMPVDFSFEGKMELRLKEQIFKANGLRVRLPGVELNANAEAVKFIDGPEFKLDASVVMNGEKVRKLAGGIVPEKMKVYIDDTGLAGEVSFKLNAAGSMVKTQKSYDIKMSGSGNADISKMEIKYSTVFLKPKNHPVVMNYKFDLAGEKIVFDSELKLKDSALKTTINLLGFEAPKINVNLDGEVGIAEVYSLIPLMEGFFAEGKAKLAGNMKIPVKKDFSVDYKGLVIDIKGKITGFGTMYTKFKYGISKLNADLSLNEKILELKNLTFLSGASLFNGYISAANFNMETMTEWKTKFTGDVKLDLKCRKFLIDEIMDALPEKKKTSAPVSTAAVKGAAGAAATTDADAKIGFTNEEINEYLVYINPGLKVDGRVELEEIVYKKVKFTDMISLIKLANKSAGLNNTVNGYSGSILNTMQIDMNVPGLGYSVAADVNGIQSGDLINAFIDSFLKPEFAAHIKDKISGSAIARLALKGSGANMRDVKKNINGSMEYKIVNGKLRNWKILGDALASVKINRTEEINFREFVGKHRIEKQKVTFEEFRIVCDDARYGVAPAGYVNFDKNLDSQMFLPVRNDLSSSISGGLGDAGKFGADEKGWFPLDVDIGGFITAPTFAPNLERAQNNLKRKAAEELKKNEGEIKKKATDLFKGLFGK